MTGTDFANRLLNNIQTSLALRSRIPYLDMLRELKQGGMSISADTLNTSSNFGSFDRALKEVLTLLHSSHSDLIAPPDVLPLPLTQIHQNLADHLNLLSEILQNFIADKESDSWLLFDKLETINLASV
ncbi:hypothetical protein AY601_1559 [Pedobacter cryoconitis]|uniref:Uncharacterized protein n=1 Tax=Pedobacter cryoconitis TaxID=188932 RepID=A0A127VAZ6_9SPHI|nr:hypothetical protein [Pedobacter cryoconitis]AMP98474.1 hypothetical protein AY601_1559 [Pedobacter cryoconitis]